MSLFDGGSPSDVAHRSINDIILASTALGTSPWWVDIGHSINDAGSTILLWGSIAVLAIRSYGMLKDHLRGRAMRRDKSEAKL